MRFLDYVKNEGYKPFHGAVSPEVYGFFHCPHPQKGRWFHKNGSYQCVGCAEQCETDDPSGFQLFLNPEAGL